MKRYPLILTTLLAVLLLVSCGKNKQEQNVAQTTGTGTAQSDSLVAANFIEAWCQTEDNAPKIEIVISALQENLDSFNAQVSFVDGTVSNFQNITREQKERIISYTAENYMLHVDLDDKGAPYRVKGTLHHTAGEQTETREISCLIEE